MLKLQPVRGTRDLLADDFRQMQFVIDTARDIARRYGFEEIATPIFEFTGVFARSMGESSDVVVKEMYSFEDRGGESLTLRPEHTAGIARAFLSNGLKQQVPVRLFAHGPTFRYERPQKGRQRQFHQIDAEIIGAPEPLADVEAIAMAADCLQALGILEHTVLMLNTLGDAESRKAYREALVGYFTAHRDRLSEDSLLRLERNPLRILDSKDKGDQAVVAGAPSLGDYLNDHSRAFFADVREGLDRLGIAYRVNDRLVRGLDYYSHTAFEFVTGALGAQGTVIGGGRYDGLMELMGGPPTPGIGWAGGIERLAMLAVGAPPPPRAAAIVPVGADAAVRALKLAHDLRQAGFCIDMAYRGNLGKRMKRANKINARCAIIIGEDELVKGAAVLRDLDSGEQHEVPLGDLPAALEKMGGVGR